MRVVRPVPLMSSHRRSRFIAVIAAVTAVGAVGWLAGVFCVPFSQVYSVKASFSQLPENDLQLTEWLRCQPNVVAHTVQIVRCGADSRDLEVSFIQVRTVSGSPTFPPLDETCDKLGYVSEGSRFSDRKR